MISQTYVHHMLNCEIANGFLLTIFYLQTIIMVSILYCYSTSNTDRMHPTASTYIHFSNSKLIEFYLSLCKYGISENNYLRGQPKVLSNGFKATGIPEAFVCILVLVVPRRFGVYGF